MNIINLKTNEVTSKNVIIERLNNEIENFFKRKTNNLRPLFSMIFISGRESIGQKLIKII